MPRSQIGPYNTFYFDMPYKKLEGYRRNVMCDMLETAAGDEVDGFRKLATRLYHFQIIRIQILPDPTRNRSHGIIRLYASYYPVRVHFSSDVQGDEHMPRADPYPYDEIPVISKSVLLKEFKQSLKRGVFMFNPTAANIKLLFSGIKIGQTNTNETDEAEDFVEYMQGIRGFWV
jgi:hypothetical protein